MNRIRHYTKTNKFIGTIIITNRDGKDIYCKAKNPNIKTINEKGKQLKPRFPHRISYTNRHTKRGNIIGTLNRLDTQNSYDTDLIDSIIDIYKELKIIRYTNNTIIEAFNKMRKDDKLKNIIKKVKTKIHALN